MKAAAIFGMTSFFITAMRSSRLRVGQGFPVGAGGVGGSAAVAGAPASSASATGGGVGLGGTGSGAAAGGGAVGTAASGWPPPHAAAKAIPTVATSAARGANRPARTRAWVAT